MLAGIIAAVLAAILLIVYLREYRSSVNSGQQPVTVLVAKTLIPRGTPGELIARQSLYQVTTVRKDQLQPLAITNPGTLTGQIAAHDINPGAQLTSTDFTGLDASELQYQISGQQRAISVPVDATHGLIGQIVAGDDVDVYVAVTGDTGPLVKLLLADVRVLAAPGAATGGVGGSAGSNTAVLRVTSKQVAEFALAADNARLWLILRPQVGAKKTLPSVATLASLIGSAG